MHHCLAASDVEATQSPGSAGAGTSQSVDGIAVGPSDESVSSTSDNIIIPVVAMGTVVIVAVCATVSLVILQRWRSALKMYTTTRCK